MPVLLCYDGSASSRQAISVAWETLGQRPVTLLHVWSAPIDVLAAAPFGTPSVPSGPSIVELERYSLERAEAIAHEGHELARHLGLVLETRVERSNKPVWQTVLDVAAETDAELIVIGTRGTTAVQSALLGSISNALVHHSTRPVLVVPGEAQPLMPPASTAAGSTTAGSE